MTQGFRRDIQGLRGIAIALVVLLHAGISGFQGGFVGVELFFVLSGYVVTESALRREPAKLGENLKHFFVSRILHLVPAAAIVVVATLLGAYFLLGPAFNDDLLADAQRAITFTENFRFIEVGANYFIQGLDQSLLNHFWYLAIEQQFYLVFPVIFFVILALVKPGTNRKVLAAVAVAATAASALWSFVQTQVDASSAYYSPWTRIWELLFGCLLALIPSGVANRVPRWLNTVFGVLGLAGIATAAIFLDATVPYPSVAAWWPVLSVALLLWSNENSAKFGPAGWLSWQPLVYLGGISYSLYLWHYVWLTLPAQLPTPLDSAWLPLLLAGALASAILSHHLIEQPLMRAERFKQDAFNTLLIYAIALALVWNACLVISRLSVTS